MNTDENRSKTYFESEQINLDKYFVKWKINNIEIIDNKKHSVVFKGTSSIYGEVIIKKQRDTSIIKNEYNILKEYNSLVEYNTINEYNTFKGHNTLKKYNQQQFCKVFDVDLENGIMIEEQIIPGTVLRVVKSLDERIMIFCSLHKGLHITPKESEIYPTYLDWVSKAENELKTIGSFQDLYLHMQIAKKICSDLFQIYPQKMLLHGDLHHDNILLNQNGTYTIIDPKGVLGHPIFDLPRFILNEMEDEITKELFDKINYIITIISKQLSVPQTVIKKLFYMEVVLSQAWNAEDGDAVRMDMVRFANEVLKSKKA